MGIIEGKEDIDKDGFEVIESEFGFVGNEDDKSGELLLVTVTLMLSVRITIIIIATKINVTINIVAQNLFCRYHGITAFKMCTHLHIYKYTCLTNIMIKCMICR